MTRNLDRRVELLFPVTDPSHKRTLVGVLDAMFRDTDKARQLQPDGTYCRVRPAEGELPFRVQQGLLLEVRRAIDVSAGRTAVTLRPR